MTTKTWLGGLGAAALAVALGLVLPLPEPPQPTAAAGAPAPVPLPAARPVAAPRTGSARTTAAPSADAGVELDRLVAAARQGDRRAAYAAYQLLSSCVQTPAPDVCRGLPPTLVQERLRFLAQAAQAGVVDAQIDFYMEGPAPVQAADGEALQAWRGQAMGLLTAAAGQCEPFAMGLLATLYDAGEMTQRSAAQALAYAVAESQLRHRAPPSDEALRNRLAEPADDAVLAAARLQGQQLAAACR
jgi:hypothetical protein